MAFKTVLARLGIAFLSLLLMGAKGPSCGDYRDAGMPIDARVNNLLCRMTLEEKAAQLKAAHSNALLASQEGGQAAGALEQRLSNGIGAIVSSGDKRPPEESARAANRLQSWLAANTRLGIPAIIDSECLHGHHGYNSTSFPTPIAMGSSWNPKLVRKAFDVAGRESRLRGSHSAHSPVLDIARDARFGRFDESFGEDSYLVSVFGKAAVAGLQGGTAGTPGTTHIIANAKHFAGYHQLDGGRNFAPTNVSRRLLLEEIARPFEVAVREADLQGIMASHNEIDGVPAHGNRWLLTDLLRDQWGFRGAVVSDFNDVIRLYEFHRVAASPAEAAVLGLEAGVDIDFPGGSSYRHLVALAEEDPSLVAYIDRGVRRVLRSKFLLGLFENPLVDPARAASGVGSDDHHALARTLAAESAVLLKNDPAILPLSLDELHTIAVIGPNADSVSHGPYASASDRTSSVLQGVRDHFGAQARVIHEPGVGFGSTEQVEGVRRLVTYSLESEEESIGRAVGAARDADLAIVVMGSEHRFSMEAYYARGHTGDRSSLALIGNQLELLRRVHGTGTPTVVVLMHGRPLRIAEVLTHSDAVLDIFYAGQALGETVAAVLAGDVNPSGRLSFSWPRSAGQLPVHYAQKPGGRFKHYLDASNTPLFPFGYGLSYTRFDLSNLVLEADNLDERTPLRFSVNVTNTGERAGQQVVQVYFRDQYAQVTRPLKQLLRFTKVPLEAGETKTVSFELNAEDLSFIGLDYQRITEPGAFELMVGHSSADIVLRRAFEYRGQD